MSRADHLLAPEAGRGPTPGSIEHGAGLLREALGYARPALSGAYGADLSRRTPCRQWRLSDLLTHVDDVLDAAAEAAGGFVLAEESSAGPGWTTADLTAKASALDDLWRRPAEGVWIGEVRIGSQVVAAALALEVAVHGWDVRASLASPARSIPDGLARRLLDVARRHAHPASGRAPQFAAPLIPPIDASDADQLLAFLGRRAGP